MRGCNALSARGRSPRAVVTTGGRRSSREDQIIPGDIIDSIDDQVEDAAGPSTSQRAARAGWPRPEQRLRAPHALDDLGGGPRRIVPRTRARFRQPHHHLGRRSQLRSEPGPEPQEPIGDPDTSLIERRASNPRPHRDAGWSGHSGGAGAAS
jgi:hypothetical protein